MQKPAHPLSPAVTALPPLLCLLALSIFINYIDRGSLSVAAPLIKEELRISASELGVLLSAFFLTYTALMPVSGWLVDRFDVSRVLATGFVVWSLATVFSGIAVGFSVLFACRMVLGAGESVAFPAYGKLIALHVPQHKRGFANAVIISGMSLGPAVGTYAFGLLMSRFGWRPVFVIFGLASLLWLLPWMYWMPPASSAAAELPVASTAEIFRKRAFWGAAVGHFCSNYPFYLMLTWLPYYLVQERHYSMQQMARESAMFYATFAIAAPIAGRLADACVRAGANQSTVRRRALGAGLCIVAAGVLGCAAANARLSFTSLLIMGFGSGLVGPNLYVFAQTLAGPRAAGKWTGLQNCFGNVAGIVVAPVTGYIVDRTGHFWLAFAVASAVALVGLWSWIIVVGPLTPIAWRGDAIRPREIMSPGLI